jgi:hypothetical protein
MLHFIVMFKKCKNSGTLEEFFGGSPGMISTGLVSLKHGWPTPI